MIDILESVVLKYATLINHNSKKKRLHVTRAVLWGGTSSAAGEICDVEDG